MRRGWRRLAAALGLLSLAALAAPGAGADEASDIAFWTSVRDSRDPREIQAYLTAFPHGLFTTLAELRLHDLEAGRAGQDGPAPATPEPAQPRPMPKARVAVTRPSFRAVDRIGVALDARPVREGSNWMLVVVPAATPEAVADPDALAAIGTPVPADYTRFTLPPGPPGQDEVRLYYIPSTGTRFVLAARAPVTVEAPAPGAVLASDLTAEAATLGPIRFRARHAGDTLTVEGQFLRMETGRQESGLMELLAGLGAPSTYVAMHVGQRGQGPRGETPDEVLCLMPSDDPGILHRLADLNPGDAVLLRGTASNWSSYASVQAVVLDPCGFAS